MGSTDSEIQSLSNIASLGGAVAAIIGGIAGALGLAAFLASGGTF